MDEPLRLSVEEIEQIQAETQERPLMPDILTITTADVAAARHEAQTAERAILTITSEDCRPIVAQYQPLSPESEALEELMRRLINAARRDHLPGWLRTAVLTPHPELTAVARGHALDMLRRGYVAHDSPEGMSAARRIEQGGVSFLACGENIGVVYGEYAHTARAIEDIQATMMNQPRRLHNHRGNLLNPIWTHVGIGVAYEPNEALMVTQNFICAPGARLSVP